MSPSHPGLTLRIKTGLTLQDQAAGLYSSPHGLSTAHSQHVAQSNMWLQLELHAGNFCFTSSHYWTGDCSPCWSSESCRKSSPTGLMLSLLSPTVLETRGEISPGERSQFLFWGWHFAVALFALPAYFLCIPTPGGICYPSTTSWFCPWWVWGYFQSRTDQYQFSSGDYWLLNPSSDTTLHN